MNQSINIQDIIPQAIELADSLCNALIHNSITHMDPNSEFQLEKIKNPLERTPIYTEFAKLLANDSPIVLQEKIAALKTVVKNLVGVAYGLPSANSRLLYEKFHFDLNTDAIGYQFNNVLKQQQSLAEKVFQNMLENPVPSHYTVAVERLHSNNELQENVGKSAPETSIPKKAKM